MEESNILARMGWKLGSWKDSGVELVHSPSAREAHQQLVVTHPPASTKCEGLSGHFNSRTANDETWDYYYDQLVAIRDKADRIVIAWVVPDEDCGHIDYKEFDTWTDAEIWKNQK